MPTVLVASDADWVRDHVRAALVGPGFEVIEVERGQDVRRAVDEREPDLVIVDLQIGNMGGMAVAIDLRLEESGGRLPHVPILLLLDREADRFLARRSSGRRHAGQADRRRHPAPHGEDPPGRRRGPSNRRSGRRSPDETPSGPEEAVG